jgi:sporulation protein YlmC with PRC-barrel domain
VFTKQTVRELEGDEILATDGAIGSVEDVYFDDERWGVRYLVVDTGTWLPGRRVLISPASVNAQGSDARTVLVNLTREQVQKAPDADSDRPVSRQYEMAHAAHFGYPYYWTGPYMWGHAAYPGRASRGQDQAELATTLTELAQGDSHLRSGKEVIGYTIEARDGVIGEVQDFVVDEKTWAISEVVVDTRKWWPGGHVLVQPEYVEGIDWHARTMRLRLTRDEVKRSEAAMPPGGA